MLKELEDYDWFPKTLRRWQMEFIGSVAVWARVYKPIVPILQEMLTEDKCNAIHDVCSGSGKPAVYLYNKLAGGQKLLFSDKYPYKSFTSSIVHYAQEPVDILQLQPERNTFYTMYNAFHHFDEITQQKIIGNMISANVPFLFVEILRPGAFNIVKIFFTTTIVQLLVAPFVKPFSLARLFFTYIVPINLFTVCYDGIISVLKSKTGKQFSKISGDNSSNTNYQLTIQELKGHAATIVYIKGKPLNL